MFYRFLPELLNECSDQFEKARMSCHRFLFHFSYSLTLHVSTLFPLLRLCYPPFLNLFSWLLLIHSPLFSLLTFLYFPYLFYLSSSYPFITDLLPFPLCLPPPLLPSALLSCPYTPWPIINSYPLTLTPAIPPPSRSLTHLSSSSVSFVFFKFNSSPLRPSSSTLHPHIFIVPSIP